MYTIGVDLGGTNIAIGICDENLNIIDKDSTPTLSERGGDFIVDDMAALAKKLIDRNGISPAEIEYVGIAAPGAINEKDGVVDASFNIKYTKYPIADKFKERFPVKKVYVANDANVAALAEALVGCAKGAKCSVMVTLGTGVGGGIILDGKIFSGGIHSAGAELGHMVIRAGGRQCTCGRRGCFEAYSSASALTAMTKEKMNELQIKEIPSKLFEVAEKAGKITARTAFDAMRLGDPYGKALVDEYIENLAVGITNLINIFQPEVLSIGGGVCNEKEYLTAPLIALVDKEQYTRGYEKRTRITVAQLKNDAGIVGAAGLGRKA